MADEPTGNLDEETRDEIFALMQSLWRDRGLTVVMVTHDSAIAKRVPHLARIKNGKLSVLREPEASKLPADTRPLPGTAPVG